MNELFTIINCILWCTLTQFWLTCEVMKAEEDKILVPVNGTALFKKWTDGTVDRIIVLCSSCNKVFLYPRSTLSLKYHLSKAFRS